MGDTRQSIEDNWVFSEVPRAFPKDHGHIYPPNAPHAVTSSLPTWESVIAWGRQDQSATENLEYTYPRFFISKPIRELISRVRTRLQIDDDNVSCMIFPSIRIANYCTDALKMAKSEAASDIHTVRFSAPTVYGISRDKHIQWTDFSVVLFPTDLYLPAFLVWMETGAGMSTRHAVFCLEHIESLDSYSVNVSFQTPGLKNIDSGNHVSGNWHQSASADLGEVRARIAKLVTSEKTHLKPVKEQDVMLFPTGMNAIFSTSEALAALRPQADVVAYGWIYPETIQVLRRSPWNEMISFKWGTGEELDELERLLKNPSQRITALFCEFPSNVKLTSPDLERIRALADQHDFIVACDETPGNFINVDVLSYADVVMTSLTKIFSGAADVTGGSVVVNPNSRHYHDIHRQLAIQHESVCCFPGDVAVLNRNSVNMDARVHKSNANTIPVIKLLQGHASVQRVHHTSLGLTSQWYRKCMRQDGGFGNVFSVIFNNLPTAERFYNHLDTCKGSSFGTNFTVAVPYVPLAYYHDQDQCEKYGLPRHIIRISIGLENGEEIMKKVVAALGAASGAEEQDEASPLESSG